MGYRVLAVDDDAFVRTVIRNRLGEDGVTVVEAKDGNEAFELVWKQKFDLIILDVILPGMDGYTICNFLRKHERTRNVPILFLSARTEMQEKLRSFELGADDYLTKPFDPMELRARVKSAIAKFQRVKAFEQAVREAECVREISLLLQMSVDRERISLELLTTLRGFFGTEMAILYAAGDDPHLPRIEAMDGPVAGFLPRLRKVLSRLQFSQQPLLMTLPGTGHEGNGKSGRCEDGDSLVPAAARGSGAPVTVLGAPLLFKGCSLGFLIFLSEDPYLLAEEHLEHLRHFLPYVATATYAAQVYEQSRQQIAASFSRLTSFYDVTSAMSLSVNVEEVLKMVVRSIRNLLRADSASLMMLNGDGELEIRHAEGLPPAVIEKTRVKIGERIAGKVWATKEAQLLVDEGGEQDEVKSSISMPLLVRGEIKGVLNVSKVSRYVFAREDVECLTHFSHLAVQAIEKTELYRDLQGAYQQLQGTLFNTVLALSRAVEAKDELTQSHIDRVTKYGLVLANLIDPDLVTDQNFIYSLMLHDIGKIKIPDQILNKPGALTPEEYAVIKTHPTEGAKIVEPVLGKCAYSILYHHERYDGGGYPEGLAGQEIPLSARIIAVADVLDVITNDRPYKKARSFPEAVEELKRVSGTQLDSVVVEVCLSAIEKGLIP